MHIWVCQVNSLDLYTFFLVLPKDSDDKNQFIVLVVKIHKLNVEKYIETGFVMFER